MMKTLNEYIKSNNVLYIHGLNSDKNSSTYKSLKKILKNYTIYTDTFDLLNPEESVRKMMNIIERKGITKIIASSLGGFYALYLDVPVGKIVINPCMDPIKEIPKLVNVSQDTLDKFNQMKKETESRIDSEDRMSVFGAFAENDELFSYSNLFTKLYGSKNMVFISGGHRPNESQLKIAVENGLKYLRNINNILDENYVFEHFVNIFIKETSDQKLLDKYKYDVYDLLVASYEPIGGLLGIENIDQLINDSNFWKLCIKNNKVVSACIYTDKRGGRKLIAAGTDGSKEGKEWLYKIIQEDIKFKNRKSWSEVSGKMEHIFIDKHNAIPVPAELAQKIMKNKPFIKIHDDGYHYDRLISGEIHTKIMVGYPEID